MINFDPFWTDLINKVENLTIYFNDYFIRNLIWSSLMRFDPFWSSLIKFDQVWSILDRSDSIWSKKLKIENLMTYFNDYLIRNPIWSSLIHFDPIWSNLIQFDPFWSILTDLIQSDQKIYKVDNLMIYFNGYLIRNQMWSSLIKFGQIWFNRIKKKLKIENLMIYFNDYVIRNWKCGKSGKIG